MQVFVFLFCGLGFLGMTHCNCTAFPYFHPLFNASEKTACDPHYFLAEWILLRIQTHLTHALIRQVTPLFWGDSCDENGAPIPHIRKQPPADGAAPENTILSVNAELRIVPAITRTLSGGQQHGVRKRKSYFHFFSGSVESTLQPNGMNVPWLMRPDCLLTTTRRQWRHL